MDGGRVIHPLDPVPPLPRLRRLQRVRVIDAKSRDELDRWDGAFGLLVGHRPGQPLQFRPDRQPTITLPVDMPRHRGGLIVEPVEA